ncbi:MAG: DUF1345 domain-containing protein [Sphingomicrobium sp.]
MAKRRSIGNIIAPPRFLAFLAIFLICAVIFGAVRDPVVSTMISFDIAAALSLLLHVPLLGIRDGAVVRSHAEANDANRALLLAITAIVMLVLLFAIASETVGQRPEPFTRGVIIVTLVLAWMFSNTVYALHYAHLAYSGPDEGCAGLEFPGNKQPLYWDFVYFSFGVGMTFQTSDVAITDGRIRRVVTIHALAAFVFNIGVLAFTINVLGSD